MQLEIRPAFPLQPVDLDHLQEKAGNEIEKKCIQDNCIHGINCSSLSNRVTSSSIFIKLLNGKTMALPFDSMAKISYYSQQIELREAIPCDQQKLLFAGKPLKEDRTFSDYGIPPNTTLYLNTGLLGGQKIFIQLHTNRKISLEVKPECTIKQLKSRIKQELLINESEQHLNYKYKPLDQEDLKLSDYQIGEEDTINFVVKLKATGPAALTMRWMNVPPIEMNVIGFMQGLNIQPGLNLQGQCINKACSEHNKTIWIPKGAGNWTLNKEWLTTCCPGCKRKITCINVGYYRCSFSFEAVISNPDKSTMNLKLEKTETPNSKYLYTYPEGAAANYIFAQVITELEESLLSCEEHTPFLTEGKGENCCKSMCNII